MLEPKPLLMIGNKRSGTSLMVKLLNLHPRIFITHEADSIWLLYQMENGWPGTFERYAWDGPVGMRLTLKTCQKMLRTASSAAASRADRFDPAATFRRMQLRRMRSLLTPWQWLRKRRVQWLGDKKPVQHCDPQLRPFLREHFPDARYIHIVRHPWAVAASMQSAAETWTEGVPPYWREGPEQILERWAVHEEWALAMRDAGFNVYTLRLEQLARRPIEEMSAVFDFLEVGEAPDATRQWLSENVSPDPNLKYHGQLYEPSDHVRRIMDRLGYKIDSAETVESAQI